MKTPTKVTQTRLAAIQRFQRLVNELTEDETVQINPITHDLILVMEMPHVELVIPAEAIELLTAPVTPKEKP